MAYDNSLPSSFLQRNIVPNSQITVGNIDFNSVITTADADKLNIDPTTVVDTGILNYASGTGWNFITAPENISWNVTNQANRVDIFGTNNPPVVAGSRGMRDLNLNDALVEGFVRNVQVEGKIAALENLLNYSLNSSDGFVSVPVYQIWANNKSYGGPEAYYIIKDIRVQEKMRDLDGNATRAIVDISLMQVPAYQVNSGRDQASKATAGAKSALIDAVAQANQNVAGTAANGGSTSANAKNAAGPAVGAAKPPNPRPPSAVGGALPRQQFGVGQYAPPPPVLPPPPSRP